ncbi:hypothetical protein AAFF_G00054750 [Aldrovandia affinis]|uniref:Interleukin-7 receptor subunit alpha n=1 Tax=Aldrovandia affinis TaxID=143900 RepID=A0AAD7WEE1_9TELE|nr:hypothetical protein AAFF_G00054750 [Aldrovandia affinis]
MVCWLWALFLPLVAHAQSGEGDDEPMVHCSSHICSKSDIGNTLTCQLDNDNIEEVANITLCTTTTRTCRTGQLEGNSITFKNLDILKTYKLRVQFVTGESFDKNYDLRHIVQPRPPWIITAKFLKNSGIAPIYIGTQYHRDYLDGELTFELKITSAIHNMTQEVSNSHVDLEGSYLKMNTDYRVQVRAKPNLKYFKGSWSEWSPSVSFSTKEPDSPLLMYAAIAAIAAVPILLLIVTLVILRWYETIKSSIWPSIPNPKNTLLQMYKPRKGSPISFNPEVFRDQIIHLVDRVEDKCGVPEHMGGRSSCEVKGRGQVQECRGLTLWNLANGHEDHSLIPPSNKRDEEEDVGGTQTSRSFGRSGIVCGSSGPKHLGVSQTGPREEPYITISSFFKTQ